MTTEMTFVKFYLRLDARIHAPHLQDTHTFKKKSVTRESQIMCHDTCDDQNHMPHLLNTYM